MSTFGQSSLGFLGSGIEVSADGCPQAKAGGITIDWDSVPTATTSYDVVPSGQSTDTPAVDFVTAGEKFLRYGTAMCRIANTGQANDGKFAPYGATVANGGTLSTAKGDVFILNRSVHEAEPGSDHAGEAIYGGLVFRGRLVVAFSGNTAPTDFTNMPVAAFETACPGFEYVND